MSRRGTERTGSLKVIYDVAWDKLQALARQTDRLEQWETAASANHLVSYSTFKVFFNKRGRPVSGCSTSLTPKINLCLFRGFFGNRRPDRPGTIWSSLMRLLTNTKLKVNRCEIFQTDHFLQWNLGESNKDKRQESILQECNNANMLYCWKQ